MSNVKPHNLIKQHRFTVLVVNNFDSKFASCYGFIVQSQKDKNESFITDVVENFSGERNFIKKIKNTVKERKFT